MARGDRTLTQSTGAVRRETLGALLLRVPFAIAGLSVVLLLAFLVAVLLRGSASRLRPWEIGAGLACSVLVGVVARTVLRRRDRRRPDRRREDYVKPAELPPAVAAFVGREPEIGRITEALAAPGGTDPVVVLLYGPDGIGKTSLAVRAARLNAADFPDGQLFINFARRPWYAGDASPELTNEQLLDAAFSSGVLALRKPQDDIPSSDQERRAFYFDRVRRDGREGGKRLIIILDEVDDAQLVNALLPPNPHCAVLVTARTLLPDIAVDHVVIELPPLAPAESLDLLRQIVDDQRVDREEADATAIVARTGGYPLAIHLAGTSIAIRPHVRLAALRGLHHEQPLSIEMPGESYAMHLSYALLAEEERAALRLTALLERPGFAVWKMATLLGTNESEAARVIDRLVLAGLLIRASNDSVGLAVYRVEDQVRRFARARLDENVSRRDQDRLRARLTQEEKNRQSGRRTGPLKELVYLPLASGRLAEAQAGARTAVELARDRGDRSAEALALAALAEVSAELGSFYAAEDLARQVLASRYAADLSKARALRCLGKLSRRRHRDDEAEDLLLEAHAAAQRAADESEVIRILRELAPAQARRSPVLAQVTIDEAFRLCSGRKDGGQTHLAGLQWAHSHVLQARNRHAEALDNIAQGERTALLHDQRVMLGWLTLRRAGIELALGNAGRARSAAEEALELFADMRHRYGKANARLVIGTVYAGSPRPDDWELAAAELEEALENFANCGDRWSEAATAQRLSRVYERLGRPLADELLAAAIRTFRELGDERSEAGAVEQHRRPPADHGGSGDEALSAAAGAARG